MASRLRNLPAAEEWNRPTSNVPAPPHRRVGSTARLNPQFGGLDVFGNPHGYQGFHYCDSSSDDDDASITPFHNPRLLRGTMGHSRSMSNPFPSLFSSKKQSKSQLAAGLSNDDDSHQPGPTNPRPRLPPKSGSRGHADFSSGNCMTCGGLVRWPKELDVFRCTICLTINDLKQQTPKTELGKSTEPQRTISLEKTKDLVQNCVRHSLRSFMAMHGKGPAPEPWPRPFSSLAPEAASKLQPPAAGRVRAPSFGNPQLSQTRSPPVFDNSTDGHSKSNPISGNRLAARSNSTSYPDTRSAHAPAEIRTGTNHILLEPKRIFKPVEDYLIAVFTYSSINSSFLPRRRPSVAARPANQIKRKPVPNPKQEHRQEKPLIQEDVLVSDLDAKLLLLGDFAENAGWWTGGQQDGLPRSQSQHKDDAHGLVNSRSPRIDWGELLEWYQLIIDAAQSWVDIHEKEIKEDSRQPLSLTERQQFEALILEAQGHLQRVLLKCTEMLLRRPGQPLQEPQDVRFLLLIIVNPLLIAGHKSYSGSYQNLEKGKVLAPNNREFEDSPTSGRHSVIIKRILGLLSHSSDQCHHQLVIWLSRLPEHLFLQIKDLISSFVNYRLKRLSERKVEVKVDVTAGLIPQMSNNRSANTAASLHAVLEATKGNKRATRIPDGSRLAYSDDWQLKAGAKVMALVFAANNHTHVRRDDNSIKHAHGHLLATSDFYNTLVDCLDFKTDFEMWESKRAKFTFCQYPFFLSIWAKIQILEFDARRQMQGKAREAFFDSILTHKTYTQYLFLSVRRDCLVEDSLAKVSEVIGSGTEDIKKGLRIEFRGEEGIDAGGLRKEWFLLLVREVFNPDHGLFVFDEDSQYCYFNPHTFETSDQYFLVGVVLGLAIYNSTILDVALPPFAFRKLLAAAPLSAAGSNSTHQRSAMTYTLDDLAEYRPRLAHGLRQLLDYDGDVENTFCLDFSIQVDKYGARVRVPLCADGEGRMVTNTNRREYVDLYVKYLLDISVSRQFEPFKRGFYTVCAGNALSLFGAEEIELLVRGSDEPLDITSLRAVAKYGQWGNDKSELEPASEPVIDWFWETFTLATPKDQRKLLSFITGSDRIPAMGAASLVIKITCLGEDEGRYPTARTCFNVLNLYRYSSRARLESCLWRAVNESEGFGLR
ncbi:hypothetical protein BX600DRAFT_451257 [Xylariales sp. PMI_506]|nr:hypothetical protein BX600DRAFT_451257 [Xylariales sp. PMI_506]